MAIYVIVSSTVDNDTIFFPYLSAKRFVTLHRIMLKVVVKLQRLKVIGH